MTAPMTSALTQYGLVRESFLTGKQQPLLIIQDIHLNNEAQSNVIKMLESLRASGKLGTIATEGASGAFDFAQFFTKDNQALRQKVADEFLAEDRIAASSYLGLTAKDASTRVVGVDDDALYEANVQAYLQTLERKDSVAAALASEQTAINNEKQNSFNPELLKLDAIVGRYEAGEMGLGALLEHLDAQTETLNNFREAYRLEKTLDFGRVEKERLRVLERLTPKLSLLETDMLIQMSVEKQADRVQRGEYYTALKSLFARHGISLGETPAFSAYLRYTLLTDGIDAGKLVRETRQAIDAALLRLTKTDKEKELLASSRQLTLQGKLINFVMTPEEWESYKLLAVSFKPTAYGLQPFENFYRIADQRSEAMVANTLRANPSVLIIGGFHTKHVTQLLKERNVAYVVMSPKITKVEGKGSEYLSVFVREKTLLEKLFAGKKLTVLPAGTLIASDAPRAEGPNHVIKEAVLPPVGWNPFVYQFDPYKQGGNLPPWWMWSIAGVTLAVLTKSIFPLSIALIPFLIPRAAPSFSDTNSTWVNENVPSLAGKKIVEVTMEMALSGKMLDALKNKGATDQEMRALAMASSTGGIGPLLNERVIAQADLGADVTAVSLLYDQVWVQRIEKAANVGERDHFQLRKIRVGHRLREVLTFVGSMPLEMLDGSIVEVKVWRAPIGMYGAGKVYFLDHPTITQEVYPGKQDYPNDQEPRNSKNRRDFEKNSRLQQNWLVGRGTLALMEKLNHRPDVLVMSEMPTVFSHNRMFTDRFQTHPLFARTKYVFNDHTPLEYAHPKWPYHELKEMRLDPRYYENLPVWTKEGEVDVIDGTAMLINAADAVYGVAKKHGDVMREMPLLHQFGPKIDSITNGVSNSYWPADEFGDLDKVKALSDENILQIKEAKRRELLEWLEKRLTMREGWAREMIAGGNPVGVWTRRIVGYKRMDVFTSLIEDLDMRKEFLTSGIIFLVGGRIHQDDTFGFEQYERIQKVLQDDSALRDRVLFFDDYNIWEAPRLFRGANFSVMLANDGREASATGFQKAQMNGGLIIGSHDGAVPESVDFYQAGKEGRPNGFEVPYEWQNDPTDGGKWSRGPTPRGLMNAFRMFREIYDDNAAYGKMVRNAIERTPRVGVTRTAQDMMYFFSEILGVHEKRKQLYEEGRIQARDLIRAAKLSNADKVKVLQQLEGLSPFEWKFRPFSGDDRRLTTSGRGLEWFLNSYRYVRSIGTAGEWSLGFHAANHGGMGDIINFLEDGLRGIPELHEVRTVVLEIGNEIVRAKNAQKSWDDNRKVIGLMEGVLEALKETTSKAPGAIWPWIRSGKSFSAIGMYEGIVTTTLLAAVMAATRVYLVSDAWVPMKQVAVVALVSFGAVALLVVVIHFALGVFRTGAQRADRRFRTVTMASLRAVPSMFGTLILAIAISAPYSHEGAFLAMVGVGILLAKHPIVNRKFDKELEPLSVHERKWAHEINYLKGHPELLAARLSKIIETPRPEGLEKYHSEANWELLQFARKDIHRPANLFFYQAARENRRNLLYAGKLDSLIGPANGLFLIPKSSDIKGLRAEVTASLALRRKETDKLYVVLSEELNEEYEQFFANYPQVEFFHQSAMDSKEEIVSLLEGILAGDTSGLKFLLHAEDIKPGWHRLLVETLFEMKADDAYMFRINLIVFNELVSGALAVSINKAEDMQAIFKFLEVIGSQA